MIVLEPIAPTHAARLQPLLEDPAIAATTPFPHPYPAGGALEYIHEAMALVAAGARHVFTVCDADGQPIGVTLLKDIDRTVGEAELGYWIGRPFWGCGRATAAAAATVRFAFEPLGLEALRAVCLVDNPASLRVLAKLGFVEIGQLFWDLPKWPEPRPCLVMRLLREEWCRTPARPRERLP